VTGEARKHERFDSDLTIKLDQGEASMRNVSASGVYFLTQLDFAVGDALSFTLEFPSMQAGVISANCAARVVRVQQQGTEKGVAAAFESIEFFRNSGSQPDG
jgi:hypothetical protein